MQQRIYRDCSRAWVVIDFYSEERQHRSRLTDLELSRLLTRVHAKEMTKELDITGCTSIFGSGLSPLRHSRVLDRVFLTDTGAEQNPTPFLSTLITMLPHALKDVVFSERCMETNKQCLAGFFHNLRELRREQAQQVNCDSCNIPVAEATQQLVPNEYGHSSVHCYFCKKHYCKRPSCSMSMRECCICADSFCDECDYCHQCYGCARSYCDCCQDDRCCVDCSSIEL